jgi:hypothetical protein
MRKLITWLHKEWMLVVAAFLIAFIPLYPKLPLLDIVHTWVYIRIEDILVGAALCSVVFFLWKHKQKPDTALTVPIVTYWVVGGFATLFAYVFLRGKIANYFPQLAVLHFLRRIEYMGLFFVGYFALWRKPKNLHVILWVLSVTLFCIIVYGIGQKFMGWPAYLTMNEEFAKGLPLRLPPTARIASTFGGHYDLAAYLVLIIPLFGGLVFGVKKIWQKIAMLLLAVVGLVMLLFTASRVSFGVYLISISMMLYWKRKPVYILPVIIVSFLLLNSVSTASSRFYKTLRFSDVVIDLSTGQPIGTLDQLEGTKGKINKPEALDQEALPKGSGYIGAPSVTTKPSKTFKTIEYFTNTPLATGSGDIATVSGNFLIQKAFVYDISLTTRLQGEWPLAIEAFKRNLLLGSGYSSLSVASDGDYMRMLGETGIVGAIAFLGIFFMAFWLYFRQRDRVSVLEESFVTGLFAGIVGLFLNALLIDVFEASKVAFTLWILLGVAISVLSARAVVIPYIKLLQKILTHKIALILYILIAVFVLYGKSISMYFVADDFSWLRGAASSTLADIPKYFQTISETYYRPIPKLFFFVLYSLFWLTPGAYHVVSLLLFTAITSIVMLILLSRGVRKSIAFGVSLLFASLSMHSSIVMWISGISAQLSVFFALLSVYISVLKMPANTYIRMLQYAGVCMCLFLTWLSIAGSGAAFLFLFVSALITIVAALCVEYFAFKRRIIITVFVFFVMIIACIWNITDLSTAINDWQRASDISQMTVLSIKKNFFPLLDKRTFVFVHVPYTYGRAQVFSHGLDDALWHMFKFNAYPYKVYEAPTVKNAYAIKSPLGDPTVLVFENGTLNLAKKEVQTIEEATP